MIKAIAFDVGNVILKWDFAPAFAAYAKHCPHAPEQIKRLLWETLVDQFDSGVHDENNFFEKARSLISLNDNVTREQFLSAWNDIFEYNREIEGLVDTLPVHLDKFLLSNTNPLHYRRAILETPVVRKHFTNRDHHVLSFEVGALKPDPAIYRELLRRTKCRPEEIVFVDDMPENIAAWEKLGGVGIEYDAKKHPIDYLHSELKHFGAL